MRAPWLALLATLAASEDVVIGPFGPIAPAPEGAQLLASLRKLARGPPKSAASAKVSHPTGLLVVGDRIFASEFRNDRVLRATTARASRDAGGAGGAGAWTVFADRGPHCAESKRTGVLDCARLDGAWGLAAYGTLLLVSSFGSDAVLAFGPRGRFRYSLYGDFDSPEGIAVAGDTLFVASFLDSRVVTVDMKTRRTRTLALGTPVSVDLDALTFVADDPFDEASTRAAHRASTVLWGGAGADSAAFVDRLRGPDLGAPRSARARASVKKC